MTSKIYSFKTQLEDLEAWYEEAIPFDSKKGKWYQGEELIREAEQTGLYEVEITFHLIDQTSQTITNRALESWRQESNVSTPFEVSEDYITIDVDTVIPFHAIAYITSKTKNVDWKGEVAKKEAKEAIYANCRKMVEEHNVTKKLWHDASERPENDKWILAQTELFGEGAFCTWLISEWVNWTEAVKTRPIKQWMYISDILPNRVEGEAPGAEPSTRKVLLIQ